MSTIQLSDQHFADITESLIYFARMGNGSKKGGSDMLRSGVTHALEIEYGSDLETVEQSIKKLVDVWAEINAAAFSLRYRGEEAAALERAPGRELTLVELYKALVCLEYNCDDGEASNLRGAYQILTNVIHRIAHHLVEITSEYDKAPWGID